MLAAGLLRAGQADAQDIVLKPLVDARLRWEDVDHDGPPQRGKGGGDARAGHPIVGDPQNIELTRA